MQTNFSDRFDSFPLQTVPGNRFSRQEATQSVAELGPHHKNHHQEVLHAKLW